MTDSEFIKATVQKILNGFKKTGETLDRLSKKVDETIAILKETKDVR